MRSTDAGEVTGFMTDGASPQKDLENILMECLVRLGYVSHKFSGSVTLHVTQGVIGDVDRYEKCLKRHPRSDMCSVD